MTKFKSKIQYVSWNDQVEGSSKLEKSRLQFNFNTSWII